MVFTRPCKWIKKKIKKRESMEYYENHVSAISGHSAHRSIKSQKSHSKTSNLPNGLIPHRKNQKSKKRSTAVLCDNSMKNVQNLGCRTIKRKKKFKKRKKKKRRVARDKILDESFNCLKENMDESINMIPIEDSPKLNTPNFHPKPVRNCRVRAPTFGLKKKEDQLFKEIKAIKRGSYGKGESFRNQLGFYPDKRNSDSKNAKALKTLHIISTRRDSDDIVRHFSDSPSKPSSPKTLQKASSLLSFICEEEEHNKSKTSEEISNQNSNKIQNPLNILNAPLMTTNHKKNLTKPYTPKSNPLSQFHPIRRNTQIPI
ncbi:unnamed protein product [Moneuplotes crassus]|uniref:Uncharacterized protein n=1 Tax=Euplotes crassus TaxID=5936 RepID=A0AAD1UNK8_EUPCR|nr:unnamed protein product [Moneuplotes crassus]